MDVPEDLKTDHDHARTDVNPSSSFYLTLSEDDIADAPFLDGPSHLSVTAVLNYCKLKILRPYLRLLSITGLRSLAVDQVESCTLWYILGLFYTIQVIILMCIGYLLQYMACFRRDRGFCYKIFNTSEPLLKSMEQDITQLNSEKYEQICHGSVIFSYIIPSVLHLCAYLFGVYTFRSSENDQLPSLMERVFLASSHLSDGFLSQKKLVKLLWIFVGLGVIWMLLSFMSVNFMMFDGTILFRWFENRSKAVIVTMKVMLIVGTLWHDIIQATVISSYCLQAQLLTSYLHFLRSKLLQHPIQSIEWMREISEFKKLLKYLNENLSTSACVFIFINICWALSGTLWLLGYDHIDFQTLPISVISILNVCLWWTLILAPFIQAARLTSACKLIKTVGHEVRARPFVHQGTPGSELDTILLYASSLDMSATLFKIPITGRALAFGVTVLAVSVLVIGQCHYLTA
ncbi:hypothetical protein PPYR_08921 [Photinus pyralis]|nr:hypothetical protein PPYR_03270 [Photinus pyralis]KAB0797928.1 hypothetical protein PPYR_08921 [Photinus pyralis]